MPNHVAAVLLHPTDISAELLGSAHGIAAWAWRSTRHVESAARDCIWQYRVVWLGTQPVVNYGLGWDRRIDGSHHHAFFVLLSNCQEWSSLQIHVGSGKWTAIEACSWCCGRAGGNRRGRRSRPQTSRPPWRKRRSGGTRRRRRNRAPPPPPLPPSSSPVTWRARGGASTQWPASTS